MHQCVSVRASARRGRSVRWLLAAALGPAGAAAAQPTIIDLGVVAGGSYSIGAALSADGTVVAGTCGVPGGERAFRWTLAGGMENLGVLPGGTSSNGNAISADGTQVAGMAYLPPNNFPRAVRWNSGGIAEVGVFPGGATSWGRGIRASGSSIVGYADTPTGDHAFASVAGGLSDLGVVVPSGTFSRAFAVSDNGVVVVGACDEFPGSASRAMRWSPASGVVSLGTLPPGSQAQSSGANDVSGDGSVVVGSCSVVGLGLNFHPFRWTSGGGMQDLGLPAGASDAFADCTNSDGSIIVGGGESAAGPRPFLWTAATGTVNLDTYLQSLGVNLAGWALRNAYDISADGTAITGFGTHNGLFRAWLVQGLPGGGAPCYADCNGDGALNLADFGCFQTKFALGNLEADCNGDLQLNLADFGCFQTAFALGCP